MWDFSSKQKMAAWLSPGSWPSTLVQTGALTRPRDEMASRWRARHVLSNLGHDHAGGDFTETGDGRQELDRDTEGALTGAPLQFAHRLLQRLDLLKVHLDHEAVVVGDSASERIEKSRLGSLQTPSSDFDQALRITLARDDGSEDGTTRHADEAADHLCQLQVGILERLLDSLGVTGDLPGELLARVEPLVFSKSRRRAHPPRTARGQQYGVLVRLRSN
jgi:hypothetical protein